MSPEAFTETTTSIAGGICQPAYVRQCARLKLLPHIITSNGQMLFQPRAKEIVRALKAQGLARRGRHARAAAQ